jgi:hypothetical protein
MKFKPFGRRKTEGFDPAPNWLDSVEKWSERRNVSVLKNQMRF